jgi:hypothetical protein
VQKSHAYPPDLADYVLQRWPSDPPLELSRDEVGAVLAVCFQASMTQEEGRPTRFRLLLTPPDRLPESGSPNEGALRLRFEQSRPFTADELRRLSPSVPFELALICAWPEQGELRIWGLAHSGPAWLAPTWGGRRLVADWTFDPIVHVSGAGRLAVRRAGVLIGGIERGTLVDVTMDVFESVWLTEIFSRERDAVRKEHQSGQLGAKVPTAVESSLVRSVAQQMLRRMIRLVRGGGHGGMVLIVDAAPLGLRPDVGSLRLKFRFTGDEPARRYRTLLFSLLERVAAASDKPSVGWTDFADDGSPELEKLEHAIFEISRVIASLTAIDGAVVLDKRFELMADRKNNRVHGFCLHGPVTGA